MGFKPPLSTPQSLEPELELAAEASARSAYLSSTDALLFSDRAGVPVLGELDASRCALGMSYNGRGIMSARTATDVHRTFADPPGDSSKRSATTQRCLRTTTTDADNANIQLVSRAHAALALHGLAVGFALAFMHFTFRPLLVAYLSLHHPTQFASARYVLEWPSALGVFIGLACDCGALGGGRNSSSRCKRIVLLGWATALLAFLGIVATTLVAPTKFTLIDDSAKHGDAVATADLEPDPTQFATLFVAFSALGSVGLHVAYVASLAATAALAQREPLAVRGQLQGSFLLLVHSAALAAMGVAARVLFPPDDLRESLRASLTMGEAGVVLCVMSAVVLPTMLFFLDDDSDVNDDHGDDPDADTPGVVARLRELLQLCEQEPVYRLLAFETGVVLLLGLYNRNVRDAVALWSRVTPAVALRVQVVQGAGIVLGLALWRARLVNTSWRTLSVVGALTYAACSLILTLAAALNGARSPVCFGALAAALEVPKAWLKVFAVVLATEIAARDRTGATVGLVVSIQWLVSVAAHAISTTLSDAIGTDVTPAQVLADMRTTRHAVVAASFVYAAVNVSSVALTPLLPQQKCAAQQLCAAGRSSKLAGYAFALVFVLLLGYSLVANISVLQSGS